MKYLLLATLVSFSAMAGAVEKDLVSCKLEGPNFLAHKTKSYAFPADAIAGEYVLVEDTKTSTGVVAAPSRLQIQVYYYEDVNGEVVRKRVPGRSLERVGYSVLGDTVTFSYMSFDGGNNPDFQISTNGESSTITYSQTGWSERDYSNELSCEILNSADTTAPVLNLASLSTDELISTLDALRYRRSSEVSSATEKSFSPALKVLETRLNNFDFEMSSISYDQVEWASTEKCGGLDIRGYYGARTILDYQRNVIGYYIASAYCKNKASYIRYRWNPNTGEKYENKEERRPYVGNLFFDKNFKLLNLDSAKSKVTFGITY